MQALCWDALKKLFTTMNRKKIYYDEQLTFRDLETVCIFPPSVIALQFIFWSSDLGKIKSRKRQQHSTDLHVAEVVK